MTVQTDKQGGHEQQVAVAEAHGEKPVLSDELGKMIDTLSGFQQDLTKLESWKVEVESDDPGLVAAYEIWKHDERNRRAEIIKSFSEKGVLKALQKVRRQNKIDKRLGLAVDPETVRMETNDEVPVGLCDCLHTLARNDVDLHLPDLDHHPFERAIFKLPGFKVAAHLGYPPLRAYLYFLMSHLGWGFGDDRKGGVELVDVMMEMYNRYYKLPLQWSLDTPYEFPSHGLGDYWI